MDDLAENNVIKFTNITMKKGIYYANFKVKGTRNGVITTASISVDISALELHSGDTLEKIIEKSAELALREIKKADFRFDDMSYLGVAQLG
ncbi:MAG: hypothetical protein COT84_00220 [Chlamydiae bacterium CG10_big_fil_rev_8_21_14_0_10_35_9]|nr:MAG: hypothetical protein COT84_00220 [Chlamydiae bacterium CG10_big_fil_rev_8_21_14_0_10_35_9]